MFHLIMHATAQPPSEHTSALQAFGVDHVVQLTGLTKRQLAYWDETGFFHPHFEAQGSGRIYSFRDLVGLRTLAILRNDHNIPLPHLRAVAADLASRTTTPWSDLRLGVANRRVQIFERETGAAFDALSGQYVLLPLGDVRDEIRRKADRLRERDANELGRTVEVRRAPPTFAGTRIPVSTILAFLDDGFATRDILKEFPTLTEADIAAALRHRETSKAA